MLTFAPCFAGLYAPSALAPIAEADRARLGRQMGKVEGPLEQLTLKTGRAYGITVDCLPPHPAPATSIWIHPEQRGFAMIDGTVHNRRELVSLLGLQDGTASDAELVFAAYRQWGPTFMEKLFGDLIAAVYDEPQGLLCTMDPSGERPFFFSEGHDLFRWATHPLLLADEHAVQCDRDYLADYLSLEIFDRTRTPYAGVRRLRAGYAVHVDDQGVTREFRWWHPPRRGSIRYAKRADYAAQLRELLMEATRCRLEHHERAGVLLSGGIDSGAVTVCVAELLRQGRTNLKEFTAFTLSTPDHPRSDESPFAAEVAAGIGVAHQRIPVPKTLDMEEVVRIAAGFPYPSGHIFLAPWFNEVARVTREKGITLVLTGAAGEIFLGDPAYLSTLLLKGDYLRFTKEVAQLWYRGVSFSQIAKSVLWCLREESQHVAFGLGRKSEENALPPGTAMDHLISDPITRELDQTITQAERIDRWDMAIFRPAGIMSKAPFLDRRLVEFAFAIPFELNIPIRKGDAPKPLLREAFPEVPCSVSRQAHRVALEDFASTQWGGNAELNALDTMLKNMDSVFDEVLNRSELANKLPTIRRPDRLNDIAEALALAIWSSALRSSAVEQFV